jgi:hypothetical protein
MLSWQCSLEWSQSHCRQGKTSKKSFLMPRRRQHDQNTGSSEKAWSSEREIVYGPIHASSAHEIGGKTVNVPLSAANAVRCSCYFAFHSSYSDSTP